MPPPPPPAADDGGDAAPAPGDQQCLRSAPTLPVLPAPLAAGDGGPQPVVVARTPPRAEGRPRRQLEIDMAAVDVAIVDAESDSDNSPAKRRGAADDGPVALFAPGDPQPGGTPRQPRLQPGYNKSMDQSIMHMSCVTRSAHDIVRTQRPIDEVLCSVDDVLGLARSAETRQNTRRTIREILCGASQTRELVVFDSHLQALLTTVFSQVAEYVDSSMMQDGTQGAAGDEDCDVLGGLVTASVMSDIVSAARLSLREYHRQCQPLRSASRRRHGTPVHSPAGGGGGRRGSKPNAGSPSPARLAAPVASSSRHSGDGSRRGSRRLSSVSFADIPDAARPTSPADIASVVLSGRESAYAASHLSVAHSFVQALTEGSLIGAPSVTPKRRPDHRVDRGDSAGGAPPSPSCSPQPAAASPPQLPAASPQLQGGAAASPQRLSPSPRGGYGEQRRKSLGTAVSSDPGTPVKGAVSPPDQSRCLTPSRAKHGGSSSRGYPSPGGSYVSGDPDRAALEKRLASLTTLQYFDIIVETLACLLSAKYEHQLRQLSHDGECSGVKRFAEWVTARVVDEMHHDGIDPSLPLDTQLMLCAEGIALEDGVYMWRRPSEAVDEAVLATVWGTELPQDIRDGTLECKDRQRTWFEWGALTKPGLITADGVHHTSPRLNPLEYGFRLASPALVASLSQLTRIRDPGDLRTASFLCARPGMRLLGAAHAGAAGDADLGGGALPVLTLSVAPEGSEHKGGNKPKPHIRPSNPAERRELERRYKKRRKQERQQMVATTAAAAELQRADGVGGDSDASCSDGESSCGGEAVHDERSDGVLIDGGAAAAAGAGRDAEAAAPKRTQSDADEHAALTHAHAGADGHPAADGRTPRVGRQRRKSAASDGAAAPPHAGDVAAKPAGCAAGCCAVC